MVVMTPQMMAMKLAKKHDERTIAPPIRLVVCDKGLTSMLRGSNTRTGRMWIGV